MAKSPAFYFTRFASCFTTVCSLILTLTWLFSLWQSHVEDQGIHLIKQGNAFLKAGDPAALQQAVQSFQKAADTFHSMDTATEAHNEGLAYFDLARAYHARQQNAQAITAAQRALPLLRGAKATRDLADTYNNLGFYYSQTQQTDKALDAYAQAQALYQASGQQDKAQRSLYVEGNLRYDQAADAARKQDWPAARDAGLQAQRLYHQANKPRAEADACHKLSLIYALMGDAERAAAMRREEQALRVAGKPVPQQ